MTAATLPRGTSAPTLQRIPLASIDTADNVRSTMDPDALEQLANSIRESGLLQPVTVATKPDGRYEVRYGHRRTEACRRLGLEAIDAIVVEASDAGDRLVDQLLENIQREDLNPLDEARALRRILGTDKGLTQAALAARLGWAESTVSNRLRILDLAKPVQQLVAEGQLSASHAKAIAGVDKDQQAAIAKEAIAQGMSAHRLEQSIADMARRLEWQQTRADEERTKRAANLAAVLQLLPKKGAQPGDPVMVQGEAMRDHLRAAGYTLLKPDNYYIQVPGPKYCDCRAWLVQEGWSGVTVGRWCVVKAHQTAAQQARDAGYDAKRKREDAARKAARDAFAAALEAHPLHRSVAELLLWQLLGYGRDQWSINRSSAAGDKGRKRDPWAQIQALSLEELHAEIRRVAYFNDAPAVLVEVKA